MNLDPSQWGRQEMQENMALLTWLLAALILAFVIVRFLSKLQSTWSRRKPGDGALEMLNTLKEERAAKKRAREMMFGSKGWYLASYPMTLIVILFYSEALASNTLAYIILNIYFATGIATTVFMRFKDKTQWEKLDFMDKGYFYVVHAWYWPRPLLEHIHSRR